jgi:plasmid maintenance system killer protein
VGSTVKLFDKSTGEMLQEYSGHINKDYRLIQNYGFGTRRPISYGFFGSGTLI